MNVIDLHCDTIELLMMDKENLELRTNDFCIDIDKLKMGNSMVQLFALFIDKKDFVNSLERCMEMADKFYVELKKNENSIALAKNYTEIKQNNEMGKISAILTVEEGAVLKGEIHNLRNLYRLGVRLVTLTWNYPNEIGFPNINEDFQGRGITSFGEDVVKEMNKLGMLIDVSHLSDEGFYDVARLSLDPFIASHSNSRTIKNHSRNLTDDMIRVISDKKGVIGINFGHAFLGDSPDSKISDMIKHIKHIRDIGGIDVIAIGSDFDGVTSKIEIKNIGEIKKLSLALEQEGFLNEDIEKIFYKNALRVIKRVLK